MSAARVTLAAIAGGFAGLGFGPVFGGFPGPFLLGLAVVTTVAGGVALIPRLSPIVAGVGGMLAVVLAAMATTGSLGDLHHGPRQLLTGSLPTEAAGAVLGTVVVLVGWSVLAAGLLASYASHPSAPLAPVLVCLLVALGFGATSRPLPAWFALVLLALVVGLLLAGRPTAPSPAIAGVATLIAVVAVAAAAFAGPIAPGVGARPAADIRNLVAAPVTPRSGVSPLQQFLALRNGIRPIKLTGTVSRPGSLLRMVTLTRFDGLFWTVDADYRRASTILAQPQVTATAVTVTQQVTVEAGELDWIPTAGRATAISVPGLGVDEATGDLAVPVDSMPPSAYTATSAVNEAEFNEVIAADPVAAPKPALALPPQLASFLDTTVSGQPSGSDELLALYRRFTGSEFKHDQSAEAPGGHGYFHIQRLLSTGRGTSEQYASAYAVFARHLGYQARVVMGFRPRYDGESFVAGAPDVDAWAEVNFAGIGWIGIDPSPRSNPEGRRPDAPPPPAQSSIVDDPLRAGAQTPPPGLPEPPRDDGSQTDSARGGAWSGVIAGAVGAVVLVVVLAAATPVAKAVQRVRRRRRASDRLAILGAWHDVLDRLREAGIRIDGTHTTGDVLRLAGRASAGIVQPALLPALAVAADRAAYAPDGPAPALRAQAWIIAADVRGQLRTGMTPARRVRALLDPRPLLGRAR
ncbi:transglutaminaseTgpA domain-containing protein [Allorhizocola rhizosphaerae]|uniref:transglutaminase family protein n=1 Tax=Allorhizocola rhizosphaerae TaxID=1872709 RepID=UPI000E3CA437|nr:transglutaminase domain-containing protein [Allorhizocola rhizosphaerae]